MRLLVSGHPCVLPVNQAVYVALEQAGWTIDLVVPATWMHEYSAEPFAARKAPGLAGAMHPVPVGLAGRPQRFTYRARLGPLVRRLRPDVAFIEEETFSVAAHQWSRALARLGVPFGLQADENLDRRLVLPARLNQRVAATRAGFVAARNPAAAALIERAFPGLPAPVIPHPIPLDHGAAARPAGPEFTIGYAGRLVPEKGLLDLVAAVAGLDGARRLLIVGAGPMLAELSALRADHRFLEIVSDATHETMAEHYARMDVLVLPSRTTPRWAEQFGRVLPEALWAGVPVVGSDSGAIPWVIEATGGGRVFPEGDVAALARTLAGLRDDDALRRDLAETGRAAVPGLFGVPAIAERMSAELLRIHAAASQP